MNSKDTSTIMSMVKKEKEKWILRTCFAVFLSVLTTLWLTGNYPAKSDDQQLSACWGDATTIYSFKKK